MRRHPVLWSLVGLVLLLWLFDQTFYTVDETEAALLVRLGAPVAVDQTPGLKAKIPLIDAVTYYDTRLLLLNPPAEQIILGDQKRIELDSFAVFRITDPLKFYQSLRTLDQARAQLTEILSSSMRRALGQVVLHSLLTQDRNAIVEGVRREVAQKAQSLGVDIQVVGIHRADLPFETSQATYDRMKSERQREAKELRAQGFEWAQQIQAKADSERTVILSEAERRSKITRGEADATANHLLAEAYGRDPGFYRFYRALQTYRQALAEAGPTLILTPDAAFLADLKAGPGAGMERK